MTAPQVTFGVLGALEVRRAGVAVAMPSRRQRAVLLLLLANLGRPVTDYALIDMAWADALPTKPKAALNTVLSRVRSTVAPATICLTPAGYVLEVADDQVDAAQFEKLCHEARGTTAERAVQLLESALAFWRGSAFDGFADHDAVAPEAVRLDEMRLRCVEDLAELRSDAGDPASAVIALEPFVEQHPFRERARELLMTALYRDGRVTAALEHYQAFSHLLAEQTGLDPSPRLRELHQRVLNHDVDEGRARGQRQAERRRSGPRWMALETAFLGRDDDAADLVDQVSSHRLVVVTGAAGVGKSRLVAETLTDLEATTQLPAVVAELAGVDSDRVDSAIAAALGVGSSGGSTREAIFEYLNLVPVLLVLDSCEHLLGALRQFAVGGLRYCPDLHIVATSRQRFAIPSEQVFPLMPLATPASDEERADLTAAMRLFADRARRADPLFVLTDTNMGTVADICRRLDGIPLAVELAASMTATLGVDQLRRQLIEDLTILDEAGNEGHRSLRKTLDSSYHLLDTPDQVLLATLGVFAGEFDLDAAVHVATRLTTRAAVPVGVGRLVDASLVAAHRHADRTRYRLLETVRTYSRERQQDLRIAHEAHLAHARWVRDLVCDAAAAATGPGDVAAISSVTRAAPDVLAAMKWSATAGMPQLAGEIAGALMLTSLNWHDRSDVLEAVRLLPDQVAVSDEKTGSLIAAAAALANIRFGELDAARHLAATALATTDEHEERFLALTALGVSALYRGDHGRSERCWQEILDITGLPTSRAAECYASLSLIACYNGRIDDARRLADHAEAHSEASGAHTGRAFARYVAAEAQAATSPVNAIPALTAASRYADEAGLRFVGGLASTAQFAALTRADRVIDALDLFDPLIERWIQLAAWPQLWTTLRIFAELLAHHDKTETAALLLSAANHAMSAPAVAGVEIDRYARLSRKLENRIGPEVHARIDLLATSLPRTAVIDRARAAAYSVRTGEKSAVRT